MPPFPLRLDPHRNSIHSGIFLGLLVAGIIFSSVIFAQEASRSITLAPLVFELAANPGDTLTENLRVTNRSDESVTIAPEVRDFTPVGEVGEVTIVDQENTTYSLQAW